MDFNCCNIAIALIDGGSERYCSRQQTDKLTAYVTMGRASRP